MADIFLSYSKADRALCAKLAAYLEAAGYTVWWDRSLKAGDEFRDEIVKELARARAVVVIWTVTSIGSDWVRSEAGRAKADGKLIPVRAADIDYKAIPPPFDVLHTEIVGNEELIRVAVVAQLAKPEVKPSAFHIAWGAFRHQFLTWFGVIGAGITLFTGLKGVIDLADWARWLVVNWASLLHAFWKVAFGWLGIAVLPQTAAALSFLIFSSSAVVSSRNRAGFSLFQPNQFSRNRLSLLLLGPWLAMAASFALLFAFFIVVATFVFLALEPIEDSKSSIIEVAGGSAFVVSVFAAPVFLARLLGLSFSVGFILTGAYFISSTILFSIPLSEMINDSPIQSSIGMWPASPGVIDVAAILMAFYAPAIMFAFGDPRSLAKRLWMSIGLAAMILALNEVSKLGLVVTAPKVPI